MKIATIIALTFALAASAASASELTNADIVKMSDAKLDESIIIAAIDSSDSKFDTSAKGLIDLSNANVPKAVIAAVIKKASATPAAALAPAAEASAGAKAELMSPSEVVFIDGNASRSMRYINPQVRTAARGLGFGGVASYAVLYGTAATERTKNASPSFLVSVPRQAQAESYLTLASFAVRQNNTREVLIGGGYMSYSSGIHPDRIVPVTAEKVADQSKAQKDFILYKVTPKRALKTGEYAVVLYTNQMHGLVSAWFSNEGNSYFDFGVDP